jgi:hypothetical protein
VAMPIRATMMCRCPITEYITGRGPSG